MVAVLRDAPRLTELEVRSGDTVLRLRRPPPRQKKGDKPARVKVPGGSGPAAAGNSATTSSVVAGTTGASASPPAPVTAHMVGVFRAGRPPIAPGDLVKAGQVVGQIEAMRLMNDIVAPGAGRVQAVFVSEGQPVEYGQPLFEIIPQEVS